MKSDLEPVSGISIRYVDVPERQFQPETGKTFWHWASCFERNTTKWSTLEILQMGNSSHNDICKTEVTDMDY